MAANLTFTTMSKIRVISNPLQSGRNGANTYYVTKGTQIVRPSRNNSNYGEGASRTPAQQARRIVWSNPVNFFKISAFWMKKAFEYKEANQTDYNKFMSLNIGRSICAFTKSEAQSAACIAEDFFVSQGSIPSVAHTKGEDVIFSSITLSPDLSLSQPVAEIVADILDKNPGLDSSYQISLIVYQQSTTIEGVPNLHCYAYELERHKNRRLWYRYFSVFTDYKSSWSTCHKTGWLHRGRLFCIELSGNKRTFTRIVTETYFKQ